MGSIQYTGIPATAGGSKGVMTGPPVVADWLIKQQQMATQRKMATQRMDEIERMRRADWLITVPSHMQGHGSGSISDYSKHNIRVMGLIEALIPSSEKILKENINPFSHDKVTIDIIQNKNTWGSIKAFEIKVRQKGNSFCLFWYHCHFESPVHPALLHLLKINDDMRSHKLGKIQYEPDYGTMYISPGYKQIKHKDLHPFDRLKVSVESYCSTGVLKLKRRLKRKQNKVDK